MKRFLHCCGIVWPLFALVFLSLGAWPARAASDALALPEEALLSDPVFARPGFANVALGYLPRTRYLLALDVDYESGQVSGRAKILFVDTTDQTLNNVVFRLYPNMPRFSAANGAFQRKMTIGQVMLDGKPAQFKLGDQWETVLDLALSAPLKPKGKADIEVVYQIAFAKAPEYVDLLEPYPLLAVYDEGGWRTDVDPSDKGLDYVYSETALYAVRVRVASNVDFWSVGNAKGKEVAGGLQTYTVVTGPVREFSGTVGSKKWGFIDATGGPVPIRVHYLGSAGAAAKISQTAISAMNFFDENLGDYPYAIFTIIVREYPSGGEEYPSFVFCNSGSDRDDNYRRFIAAHETAHQWFYGLAGNDILRHAWLDESLAQMAGYLFYENVYNPQRADSEYWPFILTWAKRVQGKPHVIDTPMNDFKDFNDYMSTVYGAGAVFLRDLNKKVGDDSFFIGLKAYVDDVYLGIGTPQQFFQHMQDQTQIDLAPFFCQRAGVACPAVG